MREMIGWFCVFILAAFVAGYLLHMIIEAIHDARYGDWGGVIFFSLLFLGTGAIWGLMGYA